MSKTLKPPKTIQEQISLMESRGIIFDDIEKAKKILIEHNYYRLTGYMYQFKENGSKYKNGIRFKKIYAIYDFDKSLRTCLFELIGILEISFKTKLAYFMCHKYGSDFYVKKDIFKDGYLYKNFKKIIKKCINQSKDKLFIKHHMEKYGRFPFWVLVEILSFSNISKLFSNINTVDKKEFLREYYRYGLKFFENWIENISIIRNTCAHHGRLYNRNFMLIKLLEEDDIEKTGKIFDSIYILKKLINDRLIWLKFVKDIDRSIVNHKDDVDLKLIGFPDDYLIKLKNYEKYS